MPPWAFGPDGRGRPVAVPVDQPGAVPRPGPDRCWAPSAAALSPTPDLLVTGDGRHLAVVDADGTPLLLRERSGDFIRRSSPRRRVSTRTAGSLRRARSAPARATLASPSIAARRAALADPRHRVLAVDRVADPGPGLRASRHRRFRALAAARLHAALAEARPRHAGADRRGRDLSRQPPRVETVAERVGQHPWAADVPDRMRYGQPPLKVRRTRNAPIRDRT